MRPGKQRRNAGRQNPAGASNSILPFEENTSGQAPAFCRSRKMRPNRQRRNAGRRNLVSEQAGAWGSRRSAMRCLPSFLRKLAYWKRVSASFVHKPFGLCTKLVKQGNALRRSLSPKSLHRFQAEKHYRGENASDTSTRVRCTNEFLYFCTNALNGTSVPFSNTVTANRPFWSK